MVSQKDLPPVFSVASVSGWLESLISSSSNVLNRIHSSRFTPFNMSKNSIWLVYFLKIIRTFETQFLNQAYLVAVAFYVRQTELSTRVSLRFDRFWRISQAARSLISPSKVHVYLIIVLMFNTYIYGIEVNIFTVDCLLFFFHFFL